MLKMKHALGIVCVFALCATTAASASAKQVGVFEPGSPTQVGSTQQLGAIMTLKQEEGRVSCQVLFHGELERPVPVLEPPPKKTTIYFVSSFKQVGECTSDVAGESDELSGAVVSMELTGLTKARAITGARLYEHQPGGLYCTYATPYSWHLASVGGADRTEWTGSGTLKRERIGSSPACAATPTVEATVGVGGAESWSGIPLETRLLG